ncbi:hypothetical protein [Arachidicoccus terrestris]|uniref:hypothetical protein n=1 Tax=Arachidicoccus terrestris TaxID=2875539 RepID=UPI001CC4E88E|nr:hypothetical protein [Arachidicoccus terrestris]UAY56218.1 hypothetical protein K9M52_04155 [Arachidicoccus terrestris]
MKLVIWILLFQSFCLASMAQKYRASILPDSLYSGKQGDFHVQGMAVDQANGFVYLSFTDKLIKLDMEGHMVGSVTGLVGHLGDLSFDDQTGKIYGSLEYKDDAIGNGIRKKLGVKSTGTVNFYIAIFDTKQITKLNINASDGQVLRTVNLKSVAEDYTAKVKLHSGTVQHRFGCSGIDGVTLAPSIGSPEGGKKYLYVAYGIYGDTARDDNDNQVLLKFDYTNWWNRYGKQLTQSSPHRSGPDKPLDQYFVKTGNTNYGIQNLAYDPSTGNFFAAVYAGSKAGNPNYNLFVIDGHTKPKKGAVHSDNKIQRVKFLSLLNGGMHDARTGIYGWYFKWGSTGLFPLGDGYFYISHNGKSSDGQQQTTLCKYKWVGSSQIAFERVH